MTPAPSIVINLPGYPFDNFPSVATISDLRALPSTTLSTGDNYVVDGGAAEADGGGGVFAWNDGLVAADDGINIVKPDDTSPGQAGRWVLTGRTGSEANVSALRADLASSASGKGASLVNTESGQSVQTLLKYIRSSAYSVSIGYDSVSGQAAAVRLGSNTSFDGLTGVAQIGGAGPKDGGNGSYLANDGHPNWSVVQSTIPFNPTEWNIYGNGVGGVAVSTGTTTLTRSTGSAWGSFMIGLTLWFDGLAYTVVSATTSTAVLSTAPPAGTACWTFVYTTGTGTCTVTGGTVTRVAGDPFVPQGFGLQNFTLNGVTYTVTAGGGETYTISSPPANGAYAYTYRANINNQVATLRLQLTAGADEENLSGYATPYAYVFGSQQSGNGKHRDWYLTSDYQAVVDLAAYGKFVSLGGPQGNEAIRALWLNNTINRMDASGGPAGLSPSLRGRGSDTNVGLGFDTKGTGAVTFTSNSFGSTEFQIFAGGAASWLGVASDATAPFINANGAAANIDVRLVPKGTGAVRFGTWTSNGDAAVNGYITVKDAAGNTRKLATIA